MLCTTSTPGHFFLQSKPLLSLRLGGRSPDPTLYRKFNVSAEILISPCAGLVFLLLRTVSEQTTKFVPLQLFPKFPLSLCPPFTFYEAQTSIRQRQALALFGLLR